MLKLIVIAFTLIAADLVAAAESSLKVQAEVGVNHSIGKKNISKVTKVPSYLVRGDAYSMIFVSGLGDTNRQLFLKADGQVDVQVEDLRPKEKEKLRFLIFDY